MGQWWFVPESSVELATIAYDLSSPDSTVVFLGAPTSGYRFSHAYEYDRKCVVLDADQAVIAALELDGGREYDVADELPQELIGSAEVVVVDAPWYIGLLQRSPAAS